MFQGRLPAKVRGPEIESRQTASSLAACFVAEAAAKCFQNASFEEPGPLIQTTTPTAFSWRRTAAVSGDKELTRGASARLAEHQLFPMTG